MRRDDETIRDARAKPGKLQKFSFKDKQGAAGDPKRNLRMEYLLKAWLHYDDDMEALKADLDPDDLDDKIAKDPWWGKPFTKPASAILEEGIAKNLMEIALSKTAQTLPAANTILPALNKRRYNKGVQKQEVANEGMHDFIKATQAPMSRNQVIEILTLHDPKFIEKKPIDLRVLTLDEAVAIEHDKGTFKRNANIEEDEDLK